MKMEFSAGGLVYKKIQNKISFALILNHDQKWTLPKGHIEKREKPEAAAQREVSEETGLNELIINRLLEKIDYWFVFEGEKIHKFVYFYLMQTSPQAELSPQLDEIQDAQWFSPEEMRKIIYYKEDIHLVQLAFERLKIKIGV